MKAIKFLPHIFLLLLVTSCMPDSLTQFEEDDSSEISGGSTSSASDGTLTALSITQVQGDVLVLEVDSIDNFNVGDTINISSDIVVATGTNSVGTVSAVTTYNSNNYLTVALGSAAAIADTYISAGGYLDNCSSGYSACGAGSVGAAVVSKVIFYISQETTFSKTFNPTVSDTSVELEYSVSPSFPNGIQVDTNTDGLNSDDAIESPVGSFSIDDSTITVDDPYTITVSVANYGSSLDSDETQSIEFYVTGKIPTSSTDDTTATADGTKVPTAAAMARYQFLRLNSNASRFYRGSRISIDTTANTNNVTGRVLLTDNSDGILVEATGDIVAGDGIDNTPSFYASETTVKEYEFWYVSSTTDFDVSDTVTTSSGGEAVVEAVDSDTNRLYVNIRSGSFASGDSITEDDGTATTTTITARENRSYVNAVVEVGSVGNFTVGGSATTAAGDKAIVIATDSTDNLLYLLVMNGTFSDGEGVDNASTYVGDETTIAMVVGPIVDITTAGGSDTSTGVTFREGSMVASANGVVQRGSGYAVSGTDIGSNKLVVQMEHFDDDKWFDVGDNLDDYTQVNVGLASPYTISAVATSNLIVGYVDEMIHVEPFVEGGYSAAILAPETLPADLTFDATTGSITGTPTSAMDATSYTVTFLYPGESSVTYTFSLAIYNQFEILQATEKGSSYLLHKEGHGFSGSKCKIFGPQVVDDPSDSLYGTSLYGYNDVVCRLEVGEKDLYKEGINLTIKSGGGMCEFVRYKPFSYQGINAGATSSTYVRYSSFDSSVCNTGTTTFSDTDASTYVTAASVQAGAGPTATRSFGSTYCVSGDCIASDSNTARNDSEDGFCQYNHSLMSDGTFTYPNTDTGSYDLITVTCAEDTAPNCECSSTKTTVSCGGNQSNRIAGAIHNSITDVSANSSTIYPAFSAVSESITLTAPIDSGDLGNFRLANYTSENSCYGSTTYHVEDSVALGITTFGDTWEAFGNTNDAFGGANLNQFYTFECLNAAGDIKARIRMQVREWDRNFIPETTEVEELTPGSPMDDSTTSCFGANCNNHADFDDNNGTDLATCAQTMAMTNGGTTVDITAGSHTITANTGTFDSDDYRRGTVISVGPGDELTFVVEEYVSTTSIIVTTPSPQSGTNLAVDYYDGFRFPLEGFSSQ